MRSSGAPSPSSPNIRASAARASSVAACSSSVGPRVSSSRICFASTGSRTPSFPARSSSSATAAGRRSSVRTRIGWPRISRRARCATALTCRNGLASSIFMLSPRSGATHSGGPPANRVGYQPTARPRRSKRSRRVRREAPPGRSRSGIRVRRAGEQAAEDRERFRRRPVAGADEVRCRPAIAVRIRVSGNCRSSWSAGNRRPCRSTKGSMAGHPTAPAPPSRGRSESEGRPRRAESVRNPCRTAGRAGCGRPRAIPTPTGRGRRRGAMPAGHRGPDPGLWELSVFGERREPRAVPLGDGFDVRVLDSAEEGAPSPTPGAPRAESVRNRCRTDGRAGCGRPQAIPAPTSRGRRRGMTPAGPRGPRSGSRGTGGLRGAPGTAGRAARRWFDVRVLDGAAPPAEEGAPSPTPLPPGGVGQESVSDRRASRLRKTSSDSGADQSRAPTRCEANRPSRSTIQVSGNWWTS